VVALVMAGKGAILGILTRLFRYRGIVPVAVALGLGQIGELSFVLAREGVRRQMLDAEQYALVLSVAIVSMVVTPLVLRLAPPIHRLRQRSFPTEPPDTSTLPRSGLQDHVVIAGAGRVGRYVAGVLLRIERPFVLIEPDQRRVDQARASGFPILFGDATQPVVLEAAGVKRARLLLVTVPSVAASVPIIQHARAMKPDLAIVARAEGIEQMRNLHDCGVYEVVQPELEAGLEITRQALLRLGLAATETQRFLDSIRDDLYAPLYERQPEQRTVARLKSAARVLDTIWLEIPAGSPVGARTLREIDVRARTGASVVAVIPAGAGAVVPNPDGEYVLREGDLVAVMGGAEAVRTLEALLSPATGERAQGGIAHSG
jgi:CPA2 family monovalent cation:H+ antiporter-2